MQFVGANWFNAVIVLLPPPPLPPTAAVVVVGVAGAAAVVVMGFAGGVDASVVKVANDTTSARLLDAETVEEELALMLVGVGVGAVAVVRGTVAEAAAAVPREGVAWHVAERDSAKLFKPSACRGLEGAAGNVPT